MRQLKKRLLALGLSLAMSLTALVGCGGGGDTASTSSSTQSAVAGSGDLSLTEPVNLNMAAAKMGTSWYSYGSIFSDILLQNLPSGSQITVETNSGATSNPLLIENGSSQFGFGYNLSSVWALEGAEVYEGRACPDLLGLVGNLDTFYYVIVTSAESGITDLADVAANQTPIRVSTTEVGNMGEVVARLVLEEYGITYEDIEAWGGQVAHNDLTTIVDAFKDGQTDLFIHNVTLGHASLTELAVTIDLNFLQMPQDMIDSMCEKYNFSTAVLPAGSFNGQDEDINCLSLTTNLVASSAMSDGVAYAITKALCENTEALHAGHVALEEFTPERACDPAGLGIPLHPGAQAYFEEAGLM